MSEITYNDPPRRPKWLPLALLLGLLAAATAMVLCLLLSSSWAKGVHTDGDLNADEQKVKHWLIDKTRGGKENIEFVSWGPHDFSGEYGAFAAKKKTARLGYVGSSDRFSNLKTLKVLRVIYRQKDLRNDWEASDVLVIIDGDRLLSSPNVGGDGWLKKLKETY